MMLRIELKGIKDFQDACNEMARSKVPFALASSINSTVFGAQTDLRKEMGQVFKPKPHPFVVKGLQYLNADVNRDQHKLFGAVFIKETEPEPWLGYAEEPGHIMRPHIFGGDRFMKRSERRLRGWQGRAVLGPDQFIRPGPGAPLDAYGNISAGQMQRILGFIKAYQEPGYNTTKQTAGHFVIPRKGVFKRIGPNSIINVLTFIRKPHYAKRFRFFEVFSDYVHKNYMKNLVQAWGMIMLKAGSRGR